MLKNYIKIASRNLRRNPGYSFINITGMAVALTVCFTIGLYVLQELNHDRFIPDSDRIMRIVLNGEIDGRPGPIAVTPPGLAPALERELPSVEVLTESQRPSRHLLGLNDRSLYLDDILWTDPNFLELFPFAVVEGVGSQALSEPGKVVLTESTAARLFGTEDPVGQTIRLEGDTEANVTDFEVAGVLENPPSNFHFPFNALFSTPGNSRYQERYSEAVHWDQWNTAGRYIYVKRTSGTTIEDFSRQLSLLEAGYDVRNTANMIINERTDLEQLDVQPLRDIHLAENVTEDISIPGSRLYVVLFSVIGVLILAVASINYVNLCTVQGMKRSREIGVRKVAGASREQLAGQFIAESVLITLISFPVALILLEMVQLALQSWVGMETAYSIAANPLLILGGFGVVLLTGLASGIYPGLFLSSLDPSESVKGGVKSQKRGVLLRKSLVAAQFAISVFLLIGTVVIYQQMQYVQEKRLGFDSEQVLSFPTEELGDQYSAFKEELLRQSNISIVSSGVALGIGKKTSTADVSPTGLDPRSMDYIYADYDYIETMGLNIVAGTGFDSQRHDVSSGYYVILNEAAVQAMDLGENPLGDTGAMQIKLLALSEYAANVYEPNVIGIVEDFHNESLRSEIRPVIIQLTPGNRGTGVARLAAGNLGDAVGTLQAVWQQFLPGRPLEFTFLDDQIDTLYRQERGMGILFSGFALVAVVIASLGLFGLAAYTAEMRTKEIGIRKVMGASITSIISLLNRDFLKLVLLGFVVAVPFAWILMSQWLQDFAYRIDIGVSVFLLAGSAALLIAFLTVSWQSVKAALANPVNSLRSE